MHKALKEADKLKEEANALYQGHLLSKPDSSSKTHPDHEIDCD